MVFAAFVHSLFIWRSKTCVGLLLIIAVKLCALNKDTLRIVHLLRILVDVVYILVVLLKLPMKA